MGRYPRGDTLGLADTMGRDGAGIFLSKPKISAALLVRCALTTRTMPTNPHYQLFPMFESDSSRYWVLSMIMGHNLYNMFSMGLDLDHGSIPESGQLARDSNNAIMRRMSPTKRIIVGC